MRAGSLGVVFSPSAIENAESLYSLLSLEARPGRAGEPETIETRAIETIDNDRAFGLILGSGCITC